VEQFENLLAENLSSLDPSIPTWVENESRKIGRLIVPDRLFEQMGNCMLIDIQKPLEERIKHIAAEYSQLPEEDLIAAVKRIQKRLGGLRTQQAIEAIQERNHDSWISNLLIYYDKTYEFDLRRHEAGKTQILDLSGKTLSEQVELLLKIKNQHHGN
jgi:tRNA 2-selenouridine synthase